VKVPDLFRPGAVAAGGRSCHQATCASAKDFSYTAFWESNPEVLGSLWLMASAKFGRGGGITLFESLHIWRRREMPLSNYTVAFPLQLQKGKLNLCLGKLLLKDY
jgi:hypothetical protein